MARKKLLAAQDFSDRSPGDADRGAHAKIAIVVTAVIPDRAAR
jgi:hypothetical protein